MDWVQHALFFEQHALDPIVFMRVLRVLFLIPSALLMLKEPMMCGGMNRLLHRLLAALFAVLALYSWDTAYTRMSLLTMGVTPASRTLLFTEIAMTTMVLLLVMKLGYDYSRWRELQKMKVAYQKCNRECGTKTV